MKVVSLLLANKQIHLFGVTSEWNGLSKLTNGETHKTEELPEVEMFTANKIRCSKVNIVKIGTRYCATFWMEMPIPGSQPNYVETSIGNDEDSFVVREKVEKFLGVKLSPMDFCVIDRPNN